MRIKSNSVNRSDNVDSRAIAGVWDAKVQRNMATPRLWSSILFICVFCALGKSLAWCQQTPFQMSIPESAIRDPNAVALIDSALAVMGGNSAWSALHGATVNGTYVENNNSPGATFTWSDEWSGPERMRRDLARAKGGPHSLYLQDGSTQAQNPPAFSSNGPKTITRPHFDKVSALIVHLPGAALFLARQDRAYRLAIMTPPPSLRTNTKCVKVQRPPQSSGENAVDIAVCFSIESSLPVSTYIALPDLLRPTRRLLETVRYDGFQAVGSVLVPKQLSVINPAKQVKTITISSASWNPAFSAATFSGGAQ